MRLLQVEFDSPQNLLKNEKGMLKALVDESGDRENLYAMAQGKRQSSSGSDDAAGNGTGSN